MRLFSFLAIFAFSCIGVQDSIHADEERPNILFVISDDQSWMHCGAYGDKHIKTPAFDRVAREGVLFNHAYAAAPSCMPSRSALLTGRNIWELEEGGNLMGLLRAKFTIFPTLLKKAGYELAATGKTWGPGALAGYFDEDGTEDNKPGKYRARSTQLLTGKAYESKLIDPIKPGMSGVDYAANFEDFLEERNQSEPFFFWLGTHEPHQRYESGAWKRAGKKLSEALVPGCFPEHPIIQGEFLDYSLEIEHFDQHLGIAIEALEQHSLLENTIIVITSDHGNPMPRSKCNLYDTGTRVPLAIRWPGKCDAGRIVDDLVNVADLAPTFIEMAGQSVPEEMTARSLMPIITSKNKTGMSDPTRDFVVTAFERHIMTRRNGGGYPMRCIRTEKFAYIRNYEPARWPAGDPDYRSSNSTFYGDVDTGATKGYLLSNFHRKDIHPYYLLSFGRRPAEELYDTETDPDQLVNLAENPEYREIKNRLSAKMNVYLKKTNDPRQNGGAPWDDYHFTRGAIFTRPNWEIRGMAESVK